MTNFLLKLKTLLKSVNSFLKKDPYPLFSILLFLVICDQALKKICLFFNLRTNSFMGFAVELIPNENFVLSLELTTDQFFKTIIITPVFVWVVFCYFLSVYYIPKNMKFIRWGWTLAVSGALSNMTDKLSTGYVFDTFAFRLRDILHLYFNFADIVQVIGWMLLIYGAVKYRRHIKKYLERRKTLIILKKEQWHFLTYIMWTAFCFGLFFFIINSQFFMQYTETSEDLREQFLLFTLKYFALVMALFLLPVLAAFIYLSNKIYGPIYAFERYVRSLIKKENPEDLQFRQQDHLKRLEVLAKEIKEHLKTQ